MKSLLHPFLMIAAFVLAVAGGVSARETGPFSPVRQPQHIDQAQKHLIQLTLAMAGLDELAKFMQEGWFLSCRSADDVLAADLANFNVNLGGGLMSDRDFLRANQATANRTIAELDSQITALDRAILACQITEGTCDLVMLGTGLGAGGVAVRKVIISQGGKQAAKLVLRGMAQAGGGLAVGFLSQEAMIQAGISKDKAKLVMKGAELFFAWKMLKVARAAGVVPAAVPSTTTDVVETAASRAYQSRVTTPKPKPGAKPSPTPPQNYPHPHDVVVPASSLRPSSQKPFADKLLDGPFDWARMPPLEVSRSTGEIVFGMTRWTFGQQAGVTHFPIVWVP